MKKLSKIEKEVVLQILSSAKDIFEKDEIVGGYTDQGNFICHLSTKKHVEAIKTAWEKIFIEF